MNVCAHPDCTTTVAGYELACHTHWYALPTKLRNRIVASRHHKRQPALTAAVEEAQRTWKPEPARLRCHSCHRITDFTDVTDGEPGQPVCIVCATAGITTTATPGPCSNCGRDTDGLLVSLTNRPPHICIDCTIYAVRIAEAS